MCCCKGSRKAKANEKERYQTLFHGEKMVFLARELDQVLSHMQKMKLRFFLRSCEKTPLIQRCFKMLSCKEFRKRKAEKALMAVVVASDS